MKVVITGGREYTDQVTIYRYLDWVHGMVPITLLINGVARGADSIARQWAIDRSVPYKDFKITSAMWRAGGPAEGPKRNGQMLDEKPHCVIAFPGNSGTANCIEQARKRQIEVIGPYIK